MGEDSKTLNTVYHIYIFFQIECYFFGQSGHIWQKYFLLHVSISASSHTKLAGAQYLRLNMCKLTCQESRK